MSILNVRRQEYKYFVNNADMYILRTLINKVMNLDPHADSVTKQYKVTSLYFDTPVDRDLDEKLDGLLEREKHRVRIYNNEY